MTFDLTKAKKYLADIDLGGTPRSMLLAAEDETREVFDEAQKQMQVVGSGVFSFAEGVNSHMRESISDSALLAQLVANKQAPAEQDPLAWFSAYSDVLQHLGWTLQESGWVDYTTRGTSAEVHEKILEVATQSFGASPAALLIITESVQALKAMKPDSSWLTIFSRESQKAKIARFQIGLVSKDPQGDVFVSLLACLIEAKNTITQVLFFKFKDAKGSFRANTAKVSINAVALMELGPTIRAKTRVYQADYVSNILNV